jgi:hypothetical protein
VLQDEVAGEEFTRFFRTMAQILNVAGNIFRGATSQTRLPMPLSNKRASKLLAKDSYRDL